MRSNTPPTKRPKAAAGMVCAPPDAGIDGGGGCGVWRRMFDALGDAVFLLNADRRILQANRAAGALFGLSPRAMLGRTCCDLVHGGAPDPNCPLERMRVSGRRESMEMALDGRWCLVTADPIDLPDGGMPGAIHTIRDITAHKRVEDALRELTRKLERRVAERTANLEDSEAKYRALIENTMDIPCRVDGQGILRYVGPQVKRYGFDPASIEGRNFLDMVYPSDRERMSAQFKETLDSGQARPSEFRVMTPDGTICWFEERGTLQRGEDGGIAAVTSVLRDVTVAKKMEDLRAEHQRQLHRLAAKLASAQDDEQRRIAAGLHDDVAQILTACAIKLAIAGDAADAGRAWCLREEAERLLRDANDRIRLLSFELASSTLYRLGLRAAVEELCDGMGERYGVRFTVDGSGHGIVVDEACATVLFKAARELLFNVVKHSGAGQATVSIVAEAGAVELSVEDNGQGFPNGGEAGIRVGKGLGLFGIRERLRDMGGTMRIESRPRIRTRITLRVPMAGGRPREAGEDDGKTA